MVIIQICTIYKGEICLFHHQYYAILHTTVGSVTPWSIRSIMMRNPGQLSSEIAQTKYRTGVNALQVIVYYFTIIRTGLSLVYNPFGALSHIIIIVITLLETAAIQTTHTVIISDP